MKNKKIIEQVKAALALEARVSRRKAEMSIDNAAVTLARLATPMQTEESSSSLLRFQIGLVEVEEQLAAISATIAEYRMRCANVEKTLKLFEQEEAKRIGGTKAQPRLAR